MGREKKSLVNCACCASAYLIVFVRNQHRFQDVVQKLQVLLPLDEIASGDAGEMQRSLRISMGSHSHSKL